MNHERNPDATASYALKPFKQGYDTRRGRGPAAGAPNAGRPPDAVRAACREAFADRVPMLAELADNGTPEVRLRALDMLGRYGLGTSFTFDATETTSGVVILPPLDTEEVLSARTANGERLEYVEEEVVYEYIGDGQSERNQPREATVDPELVRKVLEARKAHTG